jgi:hypothetical protein
VIEESIAPFRLLRSDTDRRKPRTETSADGTLVYHDRQGRRWQVYDRRGSDRRQGGAAPAGAQSGDGQRTFVSDAGETWRVRMAAADFLDQSPAALESQLARAKKSEG